MKVEIKWALIGSTLAAVTAATAIENRLAANVVAAVVEADEEAGTEKEVVLNGTVEVREGDAQQVLLRVSEDTAYNVVCDETGRKLAALAGQKVEVKGLKTGDGLVVREFKVKNTANVRD